MTKRFHPEKAWFGADWRILQALSSNGLVCIDERKAWAVVAEVKLGIGRRRTRQKGRRIGVVISFFSFFFFFIYYYYYYYSFDILLGDFSSVWTWVVDVVVGFGGGETRWLVFYHSRSHPS